MPFPPYMRNPRLETVIWLTVELLVAFACVFFVLMLLERSFIINGFFIFESSVEEKIIAYFTSMVGAAAVLICAVRMTVAEYENRIEEDEEVSEEDSQKNSDKE